MKTQKHKLVKITGIMMIAIFMMTATSCESNAQNGAKSEQATEAKPKAPKTDLHTAVMSGDLEVIKQHIKAGSDLEVKDPMGGSSPLILASLMNKLDIAKVLIEGGAKVNQTNKEGSTALHTAVFFCYPEMTKLLLENGADKNIRNQYGATPLESISAPFKDMKSIYELMGQQLGGLGVKVDLERIEKTRPQIVELLK